MATTRSFSTMLNEYLPNRLLREEVIKRDYFLKTVKKDEKWFGGNIIVPFKGAGASSIAWGGLTDAGDISESDFIRGSITSYKEVWGSLKFNHTDLMQHQGKIVESTFIRVIEDTLPDFMQYFKEAVSIQLLDGPNFAVPTAEGSVASGIYTVDHVDRFCLGQKCVIDDDNSAQKNIYVIAINLNTSEVTFSDSRGGAAFNLSDYTIAQNAKFYHDGVWNGTTSSAFQSIRDAFLSAANGGGANIHGKSKLAYPYLQAINVLGSAITATNIIEKIFEAYVDVRKKARGNASEILMSYKHFGNCMKAVEIQKGSYKVTPGSTDASEYGWTKIEVNAVASGKRLYFVGIQECPEDVIFLIDWSSMIFRSNGMFRKRKSPDNREYFEVRETTGYSYIVDVCMFGELEVTKPGVNGIIHTISY